MSISSEITRLYGVRSDIFTSLTAKGVSVPASAVLDDVPDMIDSISGGGGGGAYTIDYSSPTHSTITGPDAARANSTITPTITLDNNWVFDNLIVNGNNVYNTSFTMPATDTIVSAAIHEISPIHLKITKYYSSGNGTIQLRNVYVNGITDRCILNGVYSINGSEYNLNASDIDKIYSTDGFTVSVYTQYPSYIDIALNIDTLGYVTFNPNGYWWGNGEEAVAELYQGNTTLATITYNQTQGTTITLPSA